MEIILKHRDQYKRIYTDIVAIDALKFRYLKVQFQENNINRELCKSYTGFASQVLGQRFPVIATGNWGCGAFGGDKQLKCKSYRAPHLKTYQ